MQEEQTPIQTPAPVPSPAPEQKPAAKPASLLADDPAGAKPADAPPTPATKEQVDSFLSEFKAPEVKDSDGNLIEIDTDAIKAVAPFMVEAGLKPAQAGRMIEALVKHQHAQSVEQQKQWDAKLETLVDQAKQEFGPDLPRFVADANKGGRALFGDELWTLLRNVPLFANDARVIKAMASYGRGVSDDHGVQGRDGGDTTTDFATRWVNSSNRNQS